MTNTMTYNRAFQTASGMYLSDPVPDNFHALDPGAQNEWLADHAWEPLENLYPHDLYYLIDSAAQAILTAQAQPTPEPLATLPCGTQVSRDEYLRLHGQKEAINQALNDIELPAPIEIVEVLYKQLREVCDLIEEVEHTAAFTDWKL